MVEVIKPYYYTPLLLGSLELSAILVYYIISVQPPI